MTFKYLLPIAIFIGWQQHLIGDPSITDIYKSSKEAYDKLSSYSDETTNTQNFSGHIHSTHYDVKLDRPNFYHISWIQKNGIRSCLRSDQSGVCFISDNAAPINENSLYGDSLAWKILLMSPQYISLILPNVFFKLPQDDPLTKGPFLDERRLPDEIIAGSNCFVLVGKGNQKLQRTMWIRKVDYLIQRIKDEGVIGKIPASTFDDTPAGKEAPLEVSIVESHSNIKISELHSATAAPGLPKDK